MRSYYIPNLADAGGFPSFTITPLSTGRLTCYAYGPCFTNAEEWLSCRPTLFTGTTTSLHYPYYTETPLHEMTDAQKASFGYGNLETTTFDVSFGFWTEVRDKVAGTSTLYESYKEEWLSLCYDDMELDDREKVILGNRELYRPNDFTRYDLLYMGLTCPPSPKSTGSTTARRLRVALLRCNGQTAWYSTATMSTWKALDTRSCSEYR